MCGHADDTFWSKWIKKKQLTPELSALIEAFAKKTDAAKKAQRELRCVLSIVQQTETGLCDPECSVRLPRGIVRLARSHCLQRRCARALTSLEKREDISESWLKRKVLRKPIRKTCKDMADDARGSCLSSLLVSELDQGAPEEPNVHEADPLLIQSINLNQIQKNAFSRLNLTEAAQTEFLSAVKLAEVSCNRGAFDNAQFLPLLSARQLGELRGDVQEAAKQKATLKQEFEAAQKDYLSTLDTSPRDNTKKLTVTNAAKILQTFAQELCRQQGSLTKVQPSILLDCLVQDSVGANLGGLLTSQMLTAWNHIMRGEKTGLEIGIDVLDSSDVGHQLNLLARM
jgi:hypothetical protein